MRVLLIFAFIAAVRGATPKACCMNHKWHGVMMQVGAMKPKTADATIVDNKFMMDYDYDEKKLLLTGTSFNPNTGTWHNLTSLDDYMNGKTYVTYDGYCSVEHISPDSMTPPCIPGNFTYEGSYTLGGGSNMLTVSSFSGFAFNSMMRFTFTDDCIPVTYTQYGSNPEGTEDIIYSFVFANITQGQLSRSNPFVVPANCQVRPGTVG